MRNAINCYYCDFYIEDTDECELGYINEDDCTEWDDDDEEEEKNA